MNALANYLQSQNLTGTPAEIVAALNADITTTSINNTRWSYQGVADRLGIAVSGTILLLLKEAIAKEQNMALKANLEAELASFQIGSADGRVGGLDLSNSIRQQQMAIWIQVLTAEGQHDAAAAVAAVKQLGVSETVRKRWEAAGLELSPTEDQVAFAQQQIAVSGWCESAIGLIRQMNAGGEQTVDEIKAAISELV